MVFTLALTLMRSRQQKQTLSMSSVVRSERMPPVPAPGNGPHLVVTAEMVADAMLTEDTMLDVIINDAITTDAMNPDAMNPDAMQVH